MILSILRKIFLFPPHLYAGRSLLEASPALARYTGLDGSSLGGRCIHCWAEEEVNDEARQNNEAST